MKFRNLVTLSLGMGIFGIVIILSGCSNKPDIKRWSKDTAHYLIAKKYPKYKVKLIKCRSEKGFGSYMADCRYYLINKANYKYEYSSEFVQSANNNWYIDSTKYIGKEKYIFKNGIYQKTIEIPSK